MTMDARPGPHDPITLTGELTIYTAAETAGRLGAGLEPRGDCDLDLSGVTELDGAGLQLLLWLKHALEAHGSTLHLVAHSDAVGEVIRLLHLEQAFGIASVQGTVEGAV
jgi:anti-sigma B factor antagonist